MGAIPVPSGALAGWGDGNPSPVQLAKVTVGSASTNDVVVGDAAVYDIFDVNEDIVLLRVWTEVKTAFTASVDLCIGQSTDSDEISAVATVAATVAATLVSDTGILLIPLLYASGTNIVCEVASATVAEGLMNVYLEYVALD